MSRSDRTSRDERDPSARDAGLDALQFGQSFRGPVESLDGRPSHEHVAVIYEDRDQQLATTVPYLAQGLQRGERCMCVLAETDAEAIVEGLRATDVDVDAALESGALTFHTVDETYVSGETFDRDEVRSFFADCIEEATDEYESLRVTAEMTWILDHSASVAEFMAYESEVNELFRDGDCVGVCQYDRNRVPPEILRDVVQTHPHVVCDDAVCHNFYYAPPTEFFGSDRPDHEVDHMIQSLVDRTEAKAELEREHRESRLAALNDAAGDLMSSEDEAAIAEAAVENAADVLALPITAVASFDRESATLAPVARTDRAADALPMRTLCDRDGGPFWEGFVAGEVRTVDDPATLTGAGEELTQVVAVPLGAQGLFVTATTDRGGFREPELELVEAMAATVEMAMDRVDRKRELRKRERTLETRNETVERLRRVNDIIRSIDRALVRASSRSEIEAVVCEQLATVGPYELAWVGDHDAVTDEVAPRESAGAGEGFPDDRVIDFGDASADPVARAVETRDPQVVNDVLSDGRSATWRREALDRGYHAVVSLPLVYQDKLYGVLSVYAGQPDVFDDLERSVLTELGDTIAYAINAVESKKSLVSDERTVLEFDVRDGSLPFLTIAAETGCTVSLDEVIPRSDGQLRGYFTTRDAPADDVLALQPSLPVTELGLIAERDDRCCHFEATLRADSLAATVVEHGSRLREMSAGDGSARVVVEMAADADVREFVEMFQTRYPDSSLVARWSDERDDRTAAEFHAAFTDELTPRQLEALQTAYFNGFFERPRPRTGKEIADAMDISQPTFNAHLRTAQRKLLERLFEDEPV